MKKPISKSASGTRKASSRSGTSAKTAATANPSVLPTSKFAFILDSLRKKSPVQIRRELIEAGVITADGKLTAKYKAEKKAPRGVKRGSTAPTPAVG